MFSICLVKLNHEEIKKDLQRIAKIKSFINIYNWEGINFPSKKDDWKTSEINVTIAFNLLYAKKEKIYPADVSKYNSNREKQVILLMILKGEKLHEAKSKGQWHHPAVKKTISIFKRNYIKK